MKRNKLVSLAVLAVVALLATTCATTTVSAASPGVTVLTVQQPTLGPFTGLSYTLTGYLTGKTYGSYGYNGIYPKLITVYESKDGKAWQSVGTTWTQGSNGYYSLTISPKENAGTYYYKAVFAGDKIYKRSTSPTTTVIVRDGIQTQLILKSRDRPTEGSPITFHVDLVDGKGNPVPGQTIVLRVIGSSNYPSSWTITDPANDGKYPDVTVTGYTQQAGQQWTFYATFAGSGDYRPATSDEVTIVVGPAPV